MNCSQYGADSESDDDVEQPVMLVEMERVAQVEIPISAEEIDSMDCARLPALFVEQLEYLKAKADELAIAHAWAEFVWKFLYICYDKDGNLQNREQAMEM